MHLEEDKLADRLAVTLRKPILALSVVSGPVCLWFIGWSVLQLFESFGPVAAFFVVVSSMVPLLGLASLIDKSQHQGQM